MYFEGFFELIQGSKQLKRTIEFGNELRIEFLYSNEKNRSESVMKGVKFFFLDRDEEYFSKNASELMEFHDLIASRVIFRGLKGKLDEKKDLGKGNYSQVVLMQDFRSNQLFAVKKVSLETLTKTTKSTVFFSITQIALFNEINLLREIQHRNIPKLHEVFEDDGDFYLILEFVRGCTLIEFMRSHGKLLSEEESLEILISLLESLVYLHNQLGIMHRDLKPENIMISSDENGKAVAKLIDFGLAEKVTSANFIHPRCGTPGFVAPEIYTARPNNINYSSLCDVFSLGIVFHIMFAFL